MTTYVSNDLTGTSKVWTDAEMARMSAWANRLSSLKIEKIEDAAVKGIQENQQPTAYYNLQGRKLLSQPEHGIYICRQGQKSVVAVRK